MKEIKYWILKRCEVGNVDSRLRIVDVPADEY
jgi:hypothetical protein